MDGRVMGSSQEGRSGRYLAEVSPRSIASQLRSWWWANNGKGEFLGSETEDVVISTVITSQGGLPNFVSKIVLHHHKDGSITVDRSGEECRG
jgi:hypothetical protein